MLFGVTFWVTKPGVLLFWGMVFWGYFCGEWLAADTFSGKMKLSKIGERKHGKFRINRNSVELV